MATGVREECETECVAHVFALELERVGEVVDRRDLPLVEHPEPRHSPRDGPENRTVGLELGRVRSLDLLASRDVQNLTGTRTMRLPASSRSASGSGLLGENTKGTAEAVPFPFL